MDFRGVCFVEVVEKMACPATIENLTKGRGGDYFSPHCLEGDSGNRERVLETLSLP